MDLGFGFSVVFSVGFSFGFNVRWREFCRYGSLCGFVFVSLC
jgi:hypothetical protein